MPVTELGAAEATGTGAAAAARRQAAGLHALASLASPAAAARAAAAPRAATAPVPSGHRRRNRLAIPPLLVILAVQLALSLRLLRGNTAFQDEGLYLVAGHEEWAHWLHGAPVPHFAAYFSGAPVIYPPLGALADGIGGLVAARCVSLLFLLAATTMLHGITRRIFDRQAALFAAALFAGTAAVQFLGAFATYDAMALFLLALAAWLGVRSAAASPRRFALLAAAAGAVLAAANATKYASALFDPAVAAIVVFTAWHARGRKAALRGAGVLACVYVLLAGAALAAAGRSYWQGIAFTTLARVNGPATRADILYLSGEWVGIVAALCVVGAVAVTLTVQSRAIRALAWVLAVTSVLAPAQQARIHTLTSLFKHVGYGAWFGSVVAGVALASFPLAVPTAKAGQARRLSLAMTAAAAICGMAIAGAHFVEWPSSQRITAIIAGQIRPGGHYLVEDDDVLTYYLANRVRWQQWTSTWFFRYADPQTGQVLTGAPAYAHAIRNGYFSVVILSFGDTLAIDRLIERDVARSGAYQLQSAVPYQTTSFSGVYKIWIRKR